MLQYAWCILMWMIHCKTLFAERMLSNVGRCWEALIRLRKQKNECDRMQIWHEPLVDDALQRFVSLPSGRNGGWLGVLLKFQGDIPLDSRRLSQRNLGDFEPKERSLPLKNDVRILVAMWHDSAPQGSPDRGLALYRGRKPSLVEATKRSFV